MSDIARDAQSKADHDTFLASPRKHVLMITNHGIHQWKVVPGLPDTGGQNVFVNQSSEQLARLGFKITIANRGGYRHPITGQWQKGLWYNTGQQRILYLEDGVDEFVRKEDMADQISRLVRSLQGFLDAEGTSVDLILSHYWDGAKLGTLFRPTLPDPVAHIWIPHSLGAVKKRNISRHQWRDLRIDERIATESSLIAEVDGIVSTSSVIERSLRQDYGYSGPQLFLPPCVDTDRYHPRQVADEDKVWGFLSQRTGLTVEQIRSSKIITEISRTDVTKRKDVLIEAFAIVQRRVPNSLLLISIDDTKKILARELEGRIRELDLQNRVAVVGSVWDLLPRLYAVTDVYCTPSVMEGFGMSAQEAAATGVPIVASHLVPFVTEYLLGDDVESTYLPGGSQPVQRGQGAIVVHADDTEGFAYALHRILTDDALQAELGANAYRITVPHFTWPNMVTGFLDAIGVGP
jgi:glycosyltransferase involved in cell wall biosynthesis